jgi:hypothetical protein
MENGELGALVYYAGVLDPTDELEADVVCTP